MPSPSNRISDHPFDLKNLAEMLSSDGWVYLAAGVRKLSLYRHDPSFEGALIQYEPGAKVATHTHTGFEYIWVLEGSQQDENGTYYAGQFVVNPPNTSHSLYSPEGCVVLIHWTSPIKFI